MSYEDGSHYIHLASRMLFRSSLRTWVLICLRFIADLSLFVSLLHIVLGLDIELNVVHM